MILILEVFFVCFFFCSFILLAEYLSGKNTSKRSTLYIKQNEEGKGRKIYNRIIDEK